MKTTNLFGMSLLCSILLLAGVVSAAPQNDPSSGECNVLGHPSPLYPICIQAWSAQNRVDHLTDVGASATAIAVAQAQLNEAIATYATLGGGTVPGFVPPVTCPCEGLTFDGVQWSSAFPAERCELTGGRTAVVDAVGRSLRMQLPPLPLPGFPPKCFIASAVSFQALETTQEESDVCLASLRSIASANGVTCP